MASRLRDKKSGSWMVKNGPGFLFLIAAGALLITALVWRAELPWRGAVLAFYILLVIFLLFVGQQNSCLFDVDRRVVYIRQQRVWKRNDREIPFNEIDNVAVLSFSSGEGNRNHSVNLVLKTGEMVKLTAHSSSGKLPKKMFAQKISDTLNKYRSQPITPALDGFVRTVIESNTNGKPWSINMITANYSTPITQWVSKEIKYKEGFLLLIPAKNMSLSAAGELSKTTRFFYKKYLQNLMIPESQIPNFDGAFMLRNDEHLLGNEFTCISNDPAAAVKWITESLVEKITNWMGNSLLNGKKGEKEPHILVTTEKATLSFRNRYHQAEQIQHIADFGVSLIEGHSK